ncbi:asparagine synthase (glutamine-hydrolyzing) [Candidatus Pelagibacter sp.]|nr:asparagine synthase (glutamine-hydrolyzing) [Candidatus Pelagibacter sp.]
MCGISAIFGKNSSDFKLINNLVDGLHHRGPDHAGISKINENLIFGHNRLKIIDLSDKANQPFSYKNIKLIFNGVIYNYIELKKEITEEIYKFKTKSDTEVILASYLKWGDSCFKKFTGMFSIVLWDGNKKKLICTRDKLGIKPLYYSFKNKNLILSSEITPILKVVKSNMNEKVLFNYLNFSLYESRTQTFFEEIKQIEPGYIYKFNVNNKFEKYKYWSLFDIIKNKENRKNRINQNFVREKILDRIKIIQKHYIRSDVKTLNFLSSGLDSYYLTKLLLNEDNNLKLLLTFGFDAISKDETSQIIKTEEMKRIKHKIIRFNCKEFIDNLEKIQRQQEGPWGGPNTFFMSKLLKYANKNNFKVAYNADGADEIFGGYKKYLLPLKSLNNNVKIDYFLTHIDGTKTNTINLLKKNFESQNFNNNFKVPSKHSIHNHRYLDIMYNKLPRNFRFSDRFSMHNSIELRYPFLDHKLIELSFDLNKQSFLNSTQNKILLRKFAKDYKIKKKRHINSPQIEWLHKPTMKKYIIKCMSDSPIFDKYYDKDKTLQFLKNFFEKKPKNSFKVWQIINLDLFLRNFF